MKKKKGVVVVVVVALYPVKVGKIQFVFQDKTFTYYDDMHWAYIHGNLMCIVLASI